MKCKRFEKRILDFIVGEINEEKKKELRKHIEKCEKCRKLYNDFLFIINNSKKIESPILEENFWKAKLNLIIEKGENYILKFKPAYLGVPLFILTFTLVLLFKIYLPAKKYPSVKLADSNYELLFSEDEIIKYIDYIGEEEVEKIIEFILEER
jgi:hypothetical protein